MIVLVLKSCINSLIDMIKLIKLVGLVEMNQLMG